MRASISVFVLLAFGFLSAGSLPRLDAHALFGTRAFVGAPHSEAISMPVEAGGTTAASDLKLGSDCRGWIDATAPALRIDFQQSDDVDLEIHVDASEKNALIINGSDGRWHCAPSNSEHQSAIRLLKPNTGQIDVWVGVFQEARAATTVTVRVPAQAQP